MLAGWLSDNFSGPQFLSASLVRAVAQGMVMGPLAGIAIAAIEHEHAGSASALFNALRNLGGAVGIAVIQTFLTKREQFHSAILNAQTSLLTQSTRQRLDMLTGHFLSSGVSDRAYAYREAVVAVGRDIRHQAFMLGYSDTIIMQSAVLALGLVAVVFVRKVTQLPAGGQGH
jgi:DHA2 family multidrug resistance protein